MKYMNLIAVILTLISTILSYVDENYKLMAFTSFLCGANFVFVIYQLIDEEL